MSTDSDGLSGPSATILQFPSRGGATKPMLAIDPSPGFCMCDHIGLCEVSRMARCTDCGRALEPFDALKNLAREWDRYARNKKTIFLEVAELQKERDGLRREVANLKAQKRRVEK